MKRSIHILLFFFTLPLILGDMHAQTKNYSEYHKTIMEAEILIAKESYDEALFKYDEVFSDFSFVFLRDCKIATQLALYLGERQKAFAILRRGALTGWEIKQIRKDDFLDELKTMPAWETFESDYPKIRKDYEASINVELRSRVKKMFSKDQKRALGALFRVGSKSQDNYAEKKFAPHSEQQMEELSQIMDEFGYPGEKLIGNDYWVSTILSHHNSISENYASQDTIYPRLKPALMNALVRGEVSPFELALIDEWYRSTLGQGDYIGYGILDPPSQADLQNTNGLRAAFYLRSVETRNSLIDIQEKTGMELFLPGEGWIDGKIEVLPK